jgi:hypothetical protein
LAIGAEIEAKSFNLATQYAKANSLNKFKEKVNVIGFLWNRIINLNLAL